MNHSQMIRGMVQAQDEAVRAAPTRSSRKKSIQSTSATQEDVLRYHVKSILARDRVLSRTTNNEFVPSTKKPRRLPIRDAARLPEPTFNKTKHEQVKKEAALRKITRKLQQRAREEKKQLKKSLKIQTLAKR